MNIPKEFIGSDKAHEIARVVRGCATDEQYIDLLWRIELALAVAKAEGHQRDAATGRAEDDDLNLEGR